MKAGWEKGSIGDVAIVIAGQSPEGKYYNSESEGLPFYQGKKEFGHKFIGAPSVWTVKTTKIAAKGDILMSVRAPVGPVNFATQECCIGRGLAAIRPKKNFDSNFLYYYLISKEEEICGNEGAVFASINKKEIEGLSVPLPPLPEQQRIVAILDQGFDGIATAKANAEKNLKNAREIFESHLNTVFTQRGAGWVEKKLGDLCRFVRGPFGGSLKKSCFAPEGYAVYEQQHAIYDQFTKVRYFIDEKKFQEMKRFELSPGDLIMSCSGTMGRVAIVPSNILPGIINQALLKLSPTEKILNSFLKAWMDSNAFQESIKNHSGGAAIQNVASVKTLKEIKVSLPSVSEQKKTIDRITEMQTTTKNLESIYQQKLAAFDELKKSLLHQAFTGELTTIPDKQLDEALT